MDGATATRITRILPILNEKQKRLFLAAEAEGIGRGGVKAIHELTGVSRTTIIQGKKELGENEGTGRNRIRKSGGGRKAVTEKYVDVKREIEKIVEDETYGNPEAVLLWTTKSLRNIQEALQGYGIEVSHVTIGNLLKQLDYSLQLNQKMLQTGSPHPDRDAQFKYINEKSLEFIGEGQPVISVDTKKKELVGNFKNNGTEYHLKKNPVKVLDHDFPLKELGKVAPYGVYDISRNEGFVNLGVSHDTAEFAVESILRWWQTLGKNTYPNATKIYINSDNGGSNGSRNRLWKKQLQEMANITGLAIHVSHFPPGTSKWNKIEHKMFCYISKNWRGKPLISVETIINLISSTATSQGLKIVCKKDDNTYELGKKVTDEELSQINIHADSFHGDWNYSIAPQLV
jgi:transposase